MRPITFWKTLAIISWLITAIVIYLWLIIPDLEAKEIKICYSCIAKIESSNNPLAYNPKSKARGLYQITPICLKDYNQENGANLPLQALFDPEANEMVAKWYLMARIPFFLRNKGIPVTIGNILWAYNAGIGQVSKGIMPRETQNYIAAYKKLAKKK